MQIQFSKPIFATESDRDKMATYLSYILNMGKKQGIPYKPDDDSYFWTVDMGNDWRVKFFPDNQDTMEIIHRYKNMGAVSALSRWIAYRTGGKIVGDIFID